jgi:outer membrane protein OmpA-like peptidoglycan-associated protein
MHYFILLSSLILSLNAIAADIRGGRCFPQSTQEIINLYQQGLCGEQLTGLQSKGFNKGIRIQADRGAVRFNFDATRIKPEFIAMLQHWGQALTQMHDLRFRLEGHADMKGEENYNHTLSLQRAQTLKDYLVQHFAIDAARLEITGFGESQPLEGLPASPDEDQRRWNRRVELVKIPGNG